MKYYDIITRSWRFLNQNSKILLQYYIKEGFINLKLNQPKAEIYKSYVDKKKLEITKLTSSKIQQHSNIRLCIYNVACVLSEAEEKPRKPDQKLKHKNPSKCPGIKTRKYTKPRTREGKSEIQFNSKKKVFSSRE